MPVGVNRNNAVDPVLTGLFNQPVVDADRFQGRLAAPIQTTDGLSAQWAELSTDTDTMIDLSVNGGLDVEPIAVEASSRETGWEWTTASAVLAKYAEHVFIDEMIEDHNQASHGFSSEERSARFLGLRSARRFNYHVFRVAYASSNFTTTDATVGDLDTLSTTWVDHVQDGQWNVLSLSDAPATHSACNLRVAQRLAINDQWQTMPHAGQAGGGTSVGNSGLGDNFAGLRNAWRGLFGLELIVDQGTHTNAAGTLVTDMDDDIAIVRLADDGSPTFCTTWAHNSAMTGDGLGSIMRVATEDPWGVRVVSQVVYVVDPRQADAGALLTNVI